MISESVTRPDVSEAIFDRHFAAVHAYLARRVGPARADDLASATFAVAFERRDGFYSAAADARPWLLGIATNLMRNEVRSEQRALAALTRFASRAERETATPLPDDHDAVAQLLVDLDADQRDVLLLFAWEGLSYAQIAAALGVPVGTVRSRMSRARGRLRDALQSASPDTAARPTRQEMIE